MDVIQHPAAQMVLCVSPEGELLIPGTRDFGERIGYRNPDFDAGDYAVRNMGFVAISRTGPGRAKLRLRPALVSGHAVEATWRFIVERQIAEIELEFFDQGWNTEMVPGGGAGLQRLLALCAKPGADQSRPRFRSAPLTLEKATEDYGNPLKPIFQKWRVSSGRFDETTLPFLMRYGLSLKLVIMAAPEKRQPLRFQFISNDVQLFDGTRRGEMIGQPIENLPDKDYGAWVARAYSELVDRNQPRLDAVEATVSQPDGGARDLSYERLLLPWCSVDKGVIVTTTSVIISAKPQTGANDNPTRTPRRTGVGLTQP